jgi:hypothetical protein
MFAELAVVIPAGGEELPDPYSLDLVAAEKMPLHHAPKLDGGNEASGIEVVNSPFS